MQAIGSGDWGRARALLPKLHFKDAESQVKVFTRRIENRKT
jgi:hypothetical protein